MLSVAPYAAAAETVDDGPAEQVQAEEVSNEGTRTEETPAEEPPSGGEDAPVEEPPAEQAPPRSDPAEDAPIEEVSVEVEGRVVAVQTESSLLGDPDAADRIDADHADHDDHSGETEIFYVLETPDGRLLDLGESFDELVDDQPESGSRFSGELVVPADLVGELERSGAIPSETESGETLAEGTPEGEAALEALVDAGTPAALAAGEILPSDDAAPAAATSHRIYTAVITNRGTQPTDAAISGVMSEAAAYWQSQSEGAVTMTHASNKRYSSTAATTANQCGYSTASSAYAQVTTEAAAQFPGVSFGLGSGNHLVVIVPETCAAGSTGLGDLGTGFANGGRSIVTGFVSGGNTKLRHVSTHEIGHNLGFHHAYGFYCPPDTYCRNVEYGDLYSVMGFTTPDPGLPALNTSARAFQGITGSGEVTEVGASSARTVTLQARTASSGQRAAKVTDSDGTVYYVEYRSGTGADDGAYTLNYTGSHLKLAGGLVHAYFASGVTVLKQDPLCGTTGSCQLRTYLVANPIENERQNGSYLPGQAFRSSVSGSKLKIFVTKIQDGAATLRILGPSAASEPDPVVPKDLTATPTPSISGTTALGVTKIGKTLTANAGTWAPAPVTLSYQWRRNGTAISGATASTYKPVAADVGKQVSVAVTGTKSGYNPVTKVSSGITVEPGELTSSIPQVSGTGKVGGTLTATPGSWGPSPVTLSYQWRRADSNGENRVNISGATGTSYTPVAADKGMRISVAATGTKSGYTSVVRADLGTEIEGATLTASPTPTLSGDAQVGRTLTANSGTWSPSPVTLSYQWQRAGANISGATSSTYEPVAADVGKSIRVRVTGSKPGYNSITRNSASVTVKNADSQPSDPTDPQPTDPTNPGPGPVPAQPFDDVPRTHKFSTEIKWMYTSKLSTGTKVGGKRYYYPKDGVSREAMAAFLYRLEAPSGYTPPAVSPFADVPKSHRFYTEIAWMYDSGLSTGNKQPSGKPKYAPKSEVSREAMAAFLYRLETPEGKKAPEGYTVPTVSPFADVPKSHKFTKEIAWMHQSTLSTGNKQPNGKPKYAPKDTVSREAMAAFLYRLVNNLRA